MPSTATTNVTIGTILDLLGPPSSAVASDADQSAFESMLSVVQPPAPSTAPATNNRSTAERDSSHTSNQHEARHAPESSSRDDSANQTSETDQSSDALTESHPADDVVESDRADSSEPSDAELAAQELVAQSLAGLPQPPASIYPELSIRETADGGTASVDSELQDDLAVTSLTTNKPAIKTAARSLTKVNGVTPANAVDASTPRDSAAESTATAVENGLLETTTDSKSLASTDNLIATDSSNAQASEVAPEAALPATAESPVETTTEAVQTSSDDSGNNDRQNGDPQEQGSKSDQEAATKPSQTTDPAVVSANTPDPTIIGVAAVTQATDSQSPNSQNVSANPSPAAAGVSARSRLPAQALTSAGDTAKARGPMEIDTARLMTRVVRAFSAAQERDGEVRLRLSPAELGSLQLEIRVENGALTAKLHTETDAARTAIIENLPALREKLAEQGVRIERFDVDLMQRQTGGMPDQSGGRQPESAESQPRFVPSSRNTVSNPSAPSVIAPTAVGTAGGLNVIV